MRKTVELDVSVPASHGALGTAYEAKKMYAEAVVEFARAQELAGNKEGAQRIIDSFAKSGWPGHLQSQLKRLEEGAKTNYVPAFSFASLYVKLGKTEETFIWLEKSYQTREIDLARIKVAPEFQTLHDDPRFTDLLRRIGL
jgi:hypothetical protein